MGRNMSFFDNMIENKLKGLHTAYLAKVLSVSGNRAKIQPLGMTKAYGANAQKQSVLTSVPILKSAYKVKEKKITYITDVDFDTKKVTKETTTISEIVPISAGDIVLCDVCERDITDAKNGNNVIPALGHHNMSDSVIVGCL